MLEGNDLAQHVGQQVEITGTLMAAGSSAGSTSDRGTSGTAGTSGTGAGGSVSGGSATGTNRTGNTSARAGAANNTRLHVTSVRTLSSTCPNQ